MVYIASLWNKTSTNPKAPIANGSIEIKDTEKAEKIAQAIMRGEKVKVNLWRGKGTVDGKKYPDYQLTLDEYTPPPKAEMSDDIPF